MGLLTNRSRVVKSGARVWAACQIRTPRRVVFIREQTASTAERIVKKAARQGMTAAQETVSAPQRVVFMKIYLSIVCTKM